MLILGEIHTCLLRNSSPVRQTVVGELLGLMRGEPVPMSERPIAHAVSPDLIRGVDCSLPTGSGARSRGVGTIATHAVITAGRVLQGSAVTRAVPASSTHRQPWPHYLSRPGVVEMIGKTAATDVADGFVAQSRDPSALDLGGICEWIIDKVQLSPRLDHRGPFASRRTTTRWVAHIIDDPAATTVRFTVEEDISRSIVLQVTEADIPAAVRFCEDLALHDWVLTTVLRIVDRTDFGSRDGRQVVTSLQPAVDHLMHVWMPGAHVPDSMTPLWRELERRPGFTRQWDATVSRVRDQLSMRTLRAFHGLDLVASGQPQQLGGIGAPQ